MLIFGWNHIKTKDFGTTGIITCPNCHNKAEWHLIRIQLWFELFFIPIFPYSSKHYVVCPVCAQGCEVKRDSGEEKSFTFDGKEWLYY